jgi:hypothetical protein
MREWVAFGVLAVVEMDQEGNPAVLFFGHLEWQHPMRHEAVGVIFFILSLSFNINNTGVSARFYIKYTLRVLQQAFGIRINII